MNSQVPGPVGSWREGSSSSHVPGHMEPLLWKRSPNLPFCWGRPKIRIPDMALEEKNEGSMEVALGSLPKL